MGKNIWKIWIDTGGTFTDCLSVSPGGELKRLKLLSSGQLRLKIKKRISEKKFQVSFNTIFSPRLFRGMPVSLDGVENLISEVSLDQSIVTLGRPHKWSNASILEISTGEEVPVFAARLLTETPLNNPFPPIQLKLGSTRGTNALLENKGARTAFLVTKGFKDLLRIGTQQRNELFTLNVIKQAPLHDLVVEVDERIESDGNILHPLSEIEINRIVGLLKRKKVKSVAIALLNSYRNPIHEIALEETIRDAGFRYISMSHRLSSQIKILPRAETTLVNAYLDPIIDQYIQRIHDGLSATDFYIMSSAGGLLSKNHFHPKDSLLSGPAGGVIGALSKAKLSSENKIITFDMGGTSTDVSLCNQRPDYRYECHVAGHKIFSPSIAIETIAAGGGSICEFDGYKFIVGPRSAGAKPGPACYGAEGPLTITDVNLLLGRLDEDNFSIPLHLQKARDALRELIEKIEKKKRKKINKTVVLQSLIQICNEKMAEAIRKVSVQKGHDPSEYSLLCFGGAGGQHVCILADMLGIAKIIIPYDAGLLSAYGIGHAKVEQAEEQLILKKLNQFIPEGILSMLAEKARNKLRSQGYSNDEIHVSNQFLFLRLKGQETSLQVSYQKGIDVASLFEQEYKKIYGHWISGREIEVESVRVVVSVMPKPAKNVSRKISRHKATPTKQKLIFSTNTWKKSNVYRWEELKHGAYIERPSLIISNNSTVFLEEGWTFYLDENENALMEKKHVPRQREKIRLTEAQLELFTNRFSSIAFEMGALLQRTSFSVNVKERLDFSCALLDWNGNLIVNAPHIPVHLGSLGVCVRSLMGIIPMKEGDVIITNHPAFGGSHLPDITLVKPVFDKKILIGFVANRAHHAEIGGRTPGSMPADGKCLEEEGVLIAPTYLIKEGESQWQKIEAVLSQAKYPTRALKENIADLHGALAALTYGERALHKLCEEEGLDEVKFFMNEIKKHAGKLVRNKITLLPRKSFSATEKLDDSTPLHVKISRLKDKLVIDFTGSSGIHSGNLNATPAIVSSVVLYVLRVWINLPIPLNEGLFQYVKIVIPNGILNPNFSGDPAHLPAVVGGNTEVSQRLTDTLFKALGLSACSQGTMNNFLFGNEHFGYYETICGGTGAGPGFNGADAVHQHMTNTRITDPEILEHRYPVRLEKFEIRKGSGGKGKWKGGEGVERVFFFKEQLSINILSQHRKEKPYGMKGGFPGAIGEQFLIRSSSVKKRLLGISGADVYAGDRVVIRTPGGGGWGLLKH